jgi:hypothetical protein
MLNVKAILFNKKDCFKSVFIFKLMKPYVCKKIVKKEEIVDFFKEGFRAT